MKQGRWHNLPRRRVTVEPVDLLIFFALALAAFLLGALSAHAGEPDKCTLLPPVGAIRLSDAIITTQPPHLTNCHTVNVFGDNHPALIQLCEQTYDPPPTTTIYCEGAAGWYPVTVPTSSISWAR